MRDYLLPVNSSEFLDLSSLEIYLSSIQLKNK